MSEKQSPKEINIVFDGPPGPECGRFVEVEDENGKSISAGSWLKRPDGLWRLRLDVGLIREVAKRNSIP